MKSLFKAAESDDLIHRIGKLSSSAKAQWEKMNVAQMMAHCQRPIKVALGDLKMKRSFVGFLVGGIAKKSLTSEEPFKKNLPTDKSFIVADNRNFELEKEQLIAVIRRFSASG